MPQRARTFKVNCCLKVHNAHLKNYYPQFRDKSIEYYLGVLKMKFSKIFFYKFYRFYRI